jgi:hypothetical protein
MKLRALVVVVAVALPGVALAGSAAAILTGTFAKRISGKPAALNGSWKLKLRSDGTFEIVRNGTVVVRGEAAGVRGKLAIGDRSGPYRCRGRERAALYNYTLKAKKLTLKPVVESCAGRRALLTTGRFTKQ